MDLILFQSILMIFFLSGNYDIQGVPYVVLFLDGKKVFDFSGANTKKLDEAMEMAKKGPQS